jgi:hypothetical protein
MCCDNPNFALVTLGQENDRIFDNTIPGMYYIPVEWLKCIAARNGLFVLLSFKFCCREVLLRSSTQLVRCQSLILDSEYLVDTTYFHVGCGPCTPVTETLVEVFAAVPLNVGIRNLMKMFEEYDFHFMNSAEMLYALGRYEPCLQYYKKDGDLVLHKGCDIRKYLAHILVCKICHKYLYSFLVLLDQSVKIHPYPDHTEISKDRLNDAGIPIFEYVLDADFDVVRNKAFYGLCDKLGVNICELWLNHL